MLIPSEQLIINALNHEIRRTVLTLVYSRPYTYSELLDILRIDSGKLNYHLHFLHGFLTKQDHKNKYSITPLGTKAVGVLEEISSKLTLDDIPGLSQACTRQLRNNELVFNDNYLKAVIDTVDLVCKLVIYLERNPSVQESLNDFLDQIEVKSYSQKRTIISKVETSSLDIKKVTKIRDFWRGVYDTLSYIVDSRSSNYKMGNGLLSLKRQAKELRTSFPLSPPLKILPNLEHVISNELLGFELPSLGVGE